MPPAITVRKGTIFEEATCRFLYDYKTSTL